jgi:hypothetical protein
MVSLGHSSGIDLALLWRYCDAALALLMALLSVVFALPCRCSGVHLTPHWRFSDTL